MPQQYTEHTSANRLSRRNYGVLVYCAHGWATVSTRQVTGKVDATVHDPYETHHDRGSLGRHCQLAVSVAVSDVPSCSARNFVLMVRYVTW